MKNIILALTIALAAPAALAQQTFIPVRTITVSGMAERKVVPDEAHLNVNLNSLATKLTDAKTAHDAKLKKLMGIARDAGIDEKKVRTQSSNVQPMYEYVNQPNGQGKQVFKGYRVQTMLDITVADTSKLGSLIDTITAAGFEQGASTEWGQLLTLNYTLSKPDEVRDELLTQAIGNARAKASRMASAAGAEIARVYQVNEGNAPSFDFPRPMPMMAMAKGAAMDRAEAYAPPAGEQNVQANVTVTFELK